jgi:hypothetical protein
VRALVIACFVAGVVLMVAFEYTVTRLIGLAALFAFIVGGVFVIADPRVLGEEE